MAEAEAGRPRAILASRRQRGLAQRRYSGARGSRSNSRLLRDVTLRDKVTPNGISSLAVSATYILSVRIRYAVYRRRFRTPDDVFTFYRVLSLVRYRLRVGKTLRAR